MLHGAQNAARKVVDGIHYLADTISSVSAKPTKMLSDWMTDRIAPEYWVPNADITVTIYIYLTNFFVPGTSPQIL